MLVGVAETPIPLEFVQRIGEHPCGALVAVFLQHRRDTVLVQMHPIEILANGVLDSISAGNVRLVTLPPKGKFIPLTGFSSGIRVGIGFIHFGYLTSLLL